MSNGKQKDKDSEIPKRMLRRLEKLERYMRDHYFPTFTRIRDMKEKMEADYAIKYIETFLAANSGSLRDQALRSYALEKMVGEFYAI